MIIKKIILRNFRNYDELTLLPHEGVNLFFGSNGSGKTNLLEAVHYCALGKSHRINGDQNVVRIGEPFSFIEIYVQAYGLARKITVQLTPGEANKKNILIDGKKIQRFSDMMGCLQCVIFSPEDLGLIKDGPSVRRRYLDMMISQISRNYFISLQLYKNALEQRNALLKELKTNPNVKHGYIDVFENEMAKSAAVIVKERKKIIHIISRTASEIYHNISGKRDECLNVEYHSAFTESENMETEFCKTIAESRESDIRYGTTSVGPHRDDINITINGKNMKLYASQGQIRTGALSMKLAQLHALYETGGERPVLLLDDVMSELDKNRRMKLISEISDYQTMITCTDETDLEKKLGKRVYIVSNKNGVCHIEEKHKEKVH